MPVVYHPKTNKFREVKNLGYLLKNWKEVTDIEVTKPILASHDEATLHVQFRDGRTFTQCWASSACLWIWLHRPVFIGRMMNWGGKDIPIVAGGLHKYDPEALN